MHSQCTGGILPNTKHESNNILSVFILVKSAIDKAYRDKNYESQNYAKAKGLLSLVLPVLFQMFSSRRFSVTFVMAPGFCPSLALVTQSDVWARILFSQR